VLSWLIRGLWSASSSSFTACSTHRPRLSTSSPEPYSASLAGVTDSTEELRMKARKGQSSAGRDDAQPVRRNCHSSDARCHAVSFSVQRAPPTAPKRNTPDVHGEHASIPEAHVLRLLLGDNPSLTGALSRSCHDHFWSFFVHARVILVSLCLTHFIIFTKENAFTKN
jgi:hypothetical protein